MLGLGLLCFCFSEFVEVWGFFCVTFPLREDIVSNTCTFAKAGQILRYDELKPHYATTERKKHEM